MPESLVIDKEDHFHDETKPSRSAEKKVISNVMSAFSTDLEPLRLTLDPMLLTVLFGAYSLLIKNLVFSVRESERKSALAETELD